MQIQNALQSIGLNEKEAHVYLALLHMGEGTISDIAKAASMPRATVYLVLKSLQKKEFTGFYLKRKRRYFMAENPDKLLQISQRQQQEVEDVIPRLKAHYTASKTQPRIKFFEGKEGVRKVFHEILEEKRPLCAITSIDDMQTLARDYFKEFIRRRIAQNLKVQLLTNKSEASLRLQKTDGGELRETRFVPETYSFHTANYIYGNKFAIVLLKDYPMAILIEDEAVAKTARMQFDL